MALYEKVMVSPWIRIKKSASWSYIGIKMLNMNKTSYMIYQSYYDAYLFRLFENVGFKIL